MIENLIKILQVPQTTGLVILAFVAAIKLSKKYFDSLLDERSKALKWFTEQIENTAVIEPYRLEQIFTERYRQILSYPKIKFFLATDFPSENLHYYINAKSYFSFNDDFSVLSLNKERKFLTLRVQKNLYGIGYYISSFFSLMLIYVLPNIYHNNISSFISTYFIVVIGLFLAAVCINSQIKAEFAQYLDVNMKRLITNA